MNGDTPPGFTPMPPPHLQAQFETEGKGAVDISPKKRGGRRGPRKPKLKPDAPKKSVRKPKLKRRWRPPIVRTLLAETDATPQTGMKVDLGMALAAFRDLSPAEIKVLSACWVGLAALDKKGRATVLQVLTKVVA